jgi:hypothetical protein
VTLYTKRYIPRYSHGGWAVLDLSKGYDASARYTGDTAKSFVKHLSDKFNDGNRAVIERFALDPVDTNQPTGDSQ